MHMAKEINAAPVLIIVIAALLLSGFNANAQTVYNLKVPTSRCRLVAVDSCFNDETRQKAFDVGKEVTLLSDLYTFCTNIKVIQSGIPARIILVLDNSGSMCQEVTSCPGASMNDPTNKRVDGANAFVDSVASRCGNCEIGVIVYTGVASDTTGRNTITQIFQPTKLNDATNISRIHTAINNAKCRGGFGGGLGKTEQVSKLAKRTLTFTGIALDSAIRMVDAGFDTIGNSMERHIILLTDGDWQKPTTRQLLDAYKAAYPGRTLPTIHGVFISDSAAHVAAGFPQYGLVTCTATDSVPMDMQYLQLAATETKGMYVPGSTPQTIVATFNKLFQVIIDTTITGLASVTFTNANTGVTSDATFEQQSPGKYTVHVPAFELAFGINTFIITWVTQDTNQIRITTKDTFTVTRQTTTGTGTTKVFKTVCGVDTVDMAIICRPPQLLTTEFDTVTAKVDPQDVDIFVPNNILVRAFTPFQDEDASGVLALFHLDDKTLANSVSGGPAGAGSPVISSTAAFGNAISTGSFTTTLGIISGDFTVECWIRPGAATQTVDIIKGNGFSFGMADGYLTATIGNATITTTNAIDKNVWQHVAVARVGNKTNIYINGIPMAIEVNSIQSISGTLTIGNFSSGFLDEVRISSTARTITLLGKTILQIPTAENLQWKINATSPTSPTAILPPDMWQGAVKGQLQFQFTDLLPGPVVINFFDTMASPLLMWSKNGDPVLFGTEGVLVTAILKDTSHDGHLDMIDIKWTDDITLRDVLPSVNELIQLLHITTLDGKFDSLRAMTIVADKANKVIHIILNENTGSTLETAWKEPKVTLTKVPMTKDGKQFVVNKILDGADPIPVFACYAPSDKDDTLKITFSEPVVDDSLNPEHFLRVQGDLKSPLSSLNPNKQTIKRDNMWILVFPYNSSMKEHAIYAYDYEIQEIWASGPPSSKISIDFCYPVSLIDKVKVGPNPMIPPGITNGPTITYPDGNTKQISGIKVEVRLKRPVDGPNGQEIQGWLTVFDAVGNVLLENEPLGKEAAAILSMGWDGKNKKGMKVAGGTYLGKYVIKDIVKGEVKREERGKLKIGIKTVK
jgi:hypothetical protein